MGEKTPDDGEAGAERRRPTAATNRIVGDVALSVGLKASRIVNIMAASVVSCVSGPPWGILVAVNTGDGDIAWRCARHSPKIAGAKPATGRLNLGGPIVTPAASCSSGRRTTKRYSRVSILEERQGTVGDEARMSPHAVPITYRARDGKAVTSRSSRPARGALDDPAHPWR